MNQAQLILDDYNWKIEHKLSQPQLKLCFEYSIKTRLFYIENGDVALRIHFKDNSYLTHLI